MKKQFFTLIAVGLICGATDTLSSLFDQSWGKLMQDAIKPVPTNMGVNVAFESLKKSIMLERDQYSQRSALITNILNETELKNFPLLQKHIQQIHARRLIAHHAAGLLGLPFAYLIEMGIFGFRWPMDVGGVIKQIIFVGMVIAAPFVIAWKFFGITPNGLRDKSFAYLHGLDDIYQAIEQRNQEADIAYVRDSFQKLKDARDRRQKE